LRKFEGNIEEELEYRLISLWDLLDKTRENRAIITNLSFSHTPST